MHNPDSIFTPADAPDIANVCKQTILNTWAIPMISGGAECATMSLFFVECMGSTYSVTIRKES